VLDGLHDASIDVCRQEGGAAYAAEADGKLTGRPGVAMVTRGPGAANAMIGIHEAWQDGTPLVLFVGLVPTSCRQRGSFQEFDVRGWFGNQQQVLVLDEPGRASEVVAEAFFAARSGRPGPVVIGGLQPSLTPGTIAVWHRVLDDRTDGPGGSSQSAEAEGARSSAERTACPG
jgi:acetolactate synthase-1/2/3 large subunit